MWRTLLTTQFPSAIPIIGAPMAGIGGGLLAAEVCRAGGLGFIPAGHCLSVEDVEEHILNFKAQPYKIDKSVSYPLCLGFICHSTFRDDAGWDRFRTILEKHKPAVVQFFAPAVVRKNKKNNVTNISLAKEYCSCQILAQVGSVAEAIEAVEAGADGLIVQGSEAGGHGLRKEVGNGTLALALNVRSRFPEIPVIAAGGIVDGRGVAAMLLAGCDGVVLGTRLWATKEAIGSESGKQALINASSCDDVVRTTVFDTIQNSYSQTPWPEPYDSVGALRNETTKLWDGQPLELINALNSDASSLASDYKSACIQNDSSKTAVLSGEGVGLIDKIESAYDVITRINQDAIEILNSRPQELLST